MSLKPINQKSFPNLSPLTGTFIDTIHYLPFRIYYENTDMGGLVYHAEYLKFMERARTEFIRHLGVNQHELFRKNILFVVFNLTINYKKPAKMDDEIVVKSQLIETKTTYIVFNQEILKQDILLTDAHVKVCCINQLGKPQRLPETIHSWVNKLNKS